MLTQSRHTVLTVGGRGQLIALSSEEKFQPGCKPDCVASRGDRWRRLYLVIVVVYTQGSLFAKMPGSCNKDLLLDYLRHLATREEKEEEGRRVKFLV